MTTHVEELRSQVERVLVPAKKAYREIGSAIEAKMDEMMAMRSEQAEIRKLIRALEPEFEKQPSSNGQGRKKGPARRPQDKYSPARIAQVNEWLRANAAEFNTGDGFYSSEIVHYEGCPITSPSGISAVLTALHEQGLVRLTKTGGKGGRKHYKVVV